MTKYLMVDVPPEVEMRILQYCVAVGATDQRKVMEAAASRGLLLGLEALEAERAPAPKRRRRSAVG